MAWTDERVEQLKQLWGEGLSASQIANQMGGVTRNAVIGKVHRLGLAGRATPAAPKPKVMADMAEEDPIVAPTTPVMSFEGIGLDDDRPTVSSIGTSQCKWPIGDPAADDFHFCGQATSAAKPYCAYHSQLAFQPSQPRRETVRKQPSALPSIRKLAG